MDQIKIGNFIAEKRKEKNLTQEQLAEKIGVSNKTISKWECGRCMPDYSMIEGLCKELNISISELINGHEFEHPKEIDNESILQLVEEIDLQKIRNVEIDGLLLVLLGLVVHCMTALASSQLEMILLNILCVVALACGVFAMVWSVIRKRRAKK